MGSSVLETVEKFRLGFVADPLPGHEMYRGMMSIPYLRRAEHGDWSVVSIRFRCLEDHDRHDGHGKYNTEAGDRPRMFNTLALQQAHDTVAICEGELDAITSQACGIPAVGIPGVQAWRPHFKEPFLGYERVWIFADGDEPGRTFARTLAQTLTNAKIIQFADGDDVSSMAVKYGAEALKEKIR